MRARARRLALALGVAVASGACVSIDGGAVEASWVVHAQDGRAIRDCACSDPAIASVYLELVGQGDLAGQRPCESGGAPRAECTFVCGRQTGATPFDIPPGAYAIRAVPADASGQDLTQAVPGRAVVVSPASILRDVVRGQATEIEASLLKAACAGDCGGDDTARTCRK